MSENRPSMSGARIFAKQIEFFVGAKSIVKVGNYEMTLHGQSTVAISGQMEADYLYQLLITFHKITVGKAENFLTEVYGDRAAAQERVDDHNMWNSIVKAAICEDRKHVGLTVEQLSGLSSDDFLVYMNDGKTGTIIDCMLLNPEADAMLAIFDMYFKVLWQHRAERVFADFLNVQLDEANLAARMNCAWKIVQLFPQNQIFGVATVTLGQLPVMEHANDNLEQDHLYDCLTSFVEVAREQALQANEVKLPETTRRCMKEEMERMLRKALNRNRQIVFATLADFLDMKAADLATQFISKPSHVVNLMYEKCFHSSGAVMNLYDRLTSIPKKLWVKDYKSSTDTSDYASDGGKRYVTPWTINDDRVEEQLKLSVKDFFEKRQENSKAAKNSKGNTQAQENRSRKSRKINKKKQQGQQRKIRDKLAKKDKEKDSKELLQVAPVPGVPTAEHTSDGGSADESGPVGQKDLVDQLAEVEREKQRVEMVEGQLYDQLIEFDKEKESFLSKQQLLDEWEKRVNAEAERVNKLKKENEALLRERERKEAEEAEERRCELVQQHQIWQRLQQIALEEAQLQSKKDTIKAEQTKTQNLSQGVTEKQEQLRREWEKFDEYKRGKESELKQEKEQLLETQKRMNDQYFTNTLDLCQRLVTLATGVATNSLAQAAAAQAPDLINLTEECRAGGMHGRNQPPATGVLVDLGDAPGPSYRSTNEIEQTSKKGKSCAANCKCRDPNYHEAHETSAVTEGVGILPVLEENLAEQMD